jgi:hypothetical protein
MAGRLLPSHVSESNFQGIASGTEPRKLQILSGCRFCLPIVPLLMSAGLQNTPFNQKTDRDRDVYTLKTIFDDSAQSWTFFYFQQSPMSLLI